MTDRISILCFRFIRYGCNCLAPLITFICPEFILRCGDVSSHHDVIEVMIFSKWTKSPCRWFDATCPGWSRGKVWFLGQDRNGHWASIQHIPTFNLNRKIQPHQLMNSIRFHIHSVACCAILVRHSAIWVLTFVHRRGISLPFDDSKAFGFKYIVSIAR